MFRITIIDKDDNRVLADCDTDLYALAAHTDHETEGEGVLATAAGTASPADVFGVCLGIDRIRDDLLEENPMVKIIYCMAGKDVLDELEIKDLTKND